MDKEMEAAVNGCQLPLPLDIDCEPVRKKRHWKPTQGRLAPVINAPEMLPPEALRLRWLLSKLHYGDALSWQTQVRRLDGKMSVLEWRVERESVYNTYAEFFLYVQRPGKTLIGTPAYELRGVIELADDTRYDETLRALGWYLYSEGWRWNSCQRISGENITGFEKNYAATPRLFRLLTKQEQKGASYERYTE